MNELAVLDAIQTVRTPWLDAIVAAYTSLGNIDIGWIVLGLALLCFKRTRKIGAGFLIALAIGAVITSGIIKPLVMRARPCDIDPYVSMIIPRPTGSSFPSGHATAAFAAFGALLFARDPKSPPALTAVIGMAAVLMALSRLYAYVHYPSDVLAGMLVGLLAGFIAARAVDAFTKRRKHKYKLS